MSTDDEKKGIFMTSGSSLPYSYEYKIPSISPKDRQELDRQRLLQFVPKSKIEGQLRTLMESFESSTTDHYAVKRAKTWVTTTRTTDGELQVGIGLGPLRVFDANGKLQSESVQGIEIEIERREDK
jgi:hypothetical protein